MQPYKFERDGEVFEISSEGARYYDVNGKLRTPEMATKFIPDDVIASAVIDLGFAGWILKD